MVARVSFVSRLSNKREDSSDASSVRRAPGGELQMILDRDEVPEERQVARLLKQILDGIAFLHSLNVAHLDIKVSPSRESLCSFAFPFPVAFAFAFAFALAFALAELTDGRIPVESLRSYRSAVKNNQQLDNRPR